MSEIEQISREGKEPQADGLSFPLPLVFPAEQYPSQGASLNSSLVGKNSIPGAFERWSHRMKNRSSTSGTLRCSAPIMDYQRQSIQDMEQSKKNGNEVNVSPLKREHPEGTTQERSTRKTTESNIIVQRVKRDLPREPRVPCTRGLPTFSQLLAYPRRLCVACRIEGPFSSSLVEKFEISLKRTILHEAAAVEGVKVDQLEVVEFFLEKDESLVFIVSLNLSEPKEKKAVENLQARLLSIPWDATTQYAKQLQSMLQGSALETRSEIPAQPPAPSLPQSSSPKDIDSKGKLEVVKEEKFTEMKRIDDPSEVKRRKEPTPPLPTFHKNISESSTSKVRATSRTHSETTSAIKAPRENWTIPVSSCSDRGSGIQRRQQNDILKVVEIINKPNEGKGEGKREEIASQKVRKKKDSRAAGSSSCPYRPVSPLHTERAEVPITMEVLSPFSAQIRDRVERENRKKAKRERSTSEKVKPRWISPVSLGEPDEDEDKDDSVGRDGWLAIPESSPSQPSSHFFTTLHDPQHRNPSQCGADDHRQHENYIKEINRRHEMHGRGRSESTAETERKINANALASHSSSSFLGSVSSRVVLPSPHNGGQALPFSAVGEDTPPERKLPPPSPANRGRGTGIRMLEDGKRNWSLGVVSSPSSSLPSRISSSSSSSNSRSSTSRSSGNDVTSASHISHSSPSSHHPPFSERDRSGGAPVPHGATKRLDERERKAQDEKDNPPSLVSPFSSSHFNQKLQRVREYSFSHAVGDGFLLIDLYRRTRTAGPGKSEAEKVAEQLELFFEGSAGTLTVREVKEYVSAYINVAAYKLTLVFDKQELSDELVGSTLKWTNGSLIEVFEQDGDNHVKEEEQAIEKSEMINFSNRYSQQRHQKVKAPRSVLAVPKKNRKITQNSVSHQRKKVKKKPLNAFPGSVSEHHDQDDRNDAMQLPISSSFSSLSALSGEYGEETTHMRTSMEDHNAGYSKMDVRPEAKRTTDISRHVTSLRKSSGKEDLRNGEEEEEEDEDRLPGPKRCHFVPYPSSLSSLQRTFTAPPSPPCNAFRSESSTNSVGSSGLFPPPPPPPLPTQRTRGKRLLANNVEMGNFEGDMDLFSEEEAGPQPLSHPPFPYHR